MQQSGQHSGPAQETDRTAELDNLGILDMQDVMQEQDLNLAQMEQSVASTRVSAFAACPALCRPFKRLFMHLTVFPGGIGSHDTTDSLQFRFLCTGGR